MRSRNHTLRRTLLAAAALLACGSAAALEFDTGQEDLKVRLEQAIRHADPDIVLSTDGEVIREGAVEPLRRVTRARWIHWFPWQEGLDETIRRAASTSDQVFVAGAERAAHWSKESGTTIYTLDAGCDPSVHRPLRVREPFRANVVFAGSDSLSATGMAEAYMNG